MKEIHFGIIILTCNPDKMAGSRKTKKHFRDFPGSFVWLSYVSSTVVVVVAVCSLLFLFLT